jgi:hypothetical protein
MQKLADADSAHFSYEEKANNAGSVSRFIKRLKAF